jgi:hypothetical protein
MLAALPIGFAYCFDCECITGAENHIDHWKIIRGPTDLVLPFKAWENLLGKKAAKRL